MKPSVQTHALTGITSLGRYNKTKAWKKSVDESIYDAIRPEGEIDEKAITTLQTRRQKKLDLARSKTDELVYSRPSELMIDSP